MTNQNNEVKETLYCPFCGGRLRKKGKLYLAVGFRQKFECAKCRRSTIRPVHNPKIEGG